MANRKSRRIESEKMYDNPIIPTHGKQITSKPTIYVDTETGECLNKKQKETREKERREQYVEESYRYEKECPNPYEIKLKKISYGKFIKTKNEQLTLF